MVSHGEGTPQLLRGHADGLGQRVVSWPAQGPPVEALRLTATLAADEQFVAALPAALAGVAGVSDPRLGGPPGLEHVGDPPRPVLVAPYIDGRRVTTVLSDAEAAGGRLPTSAALFVVREVFSAVGALHRQAAGTCHGAIGPDRVVVTSDGRVVLVDHALGRALAAAAPRDPWHWWRAFGIAIPLDRQSPPFSPDTDQIQIGLLALALLLGRPLDRDAYPDAVLDLVDQARETDLDGESFPLGPALREWVLRLLHISDVGAYPDLASASAGLDALLGAGGGYVAAPLGLGTEANALRPIGGADAGDAHAPVADILEDADATGAPDAVVWVGPDDATTEPAVEQDAVAADSAPEAAAYGFLPPAPSAPEGSAILDLANDLVGAGSRPPGAAAADAPAGAAGGSEAQAGRGRPVARRVRRGGCSRRTFATIASVVLVVGGGAAAAGYYVMSGAGRPGQLHLESVPPGGTVRVEGKRVGTTPLEVSLAPGLNFVEVSGAHSSYTLAVTVEPGGRHAERVKLPEAGAPGTVVVRTSPEGVPVSVNGKERGVGPLELQLVPGRHVVTAANGTARIERDVQVPAAGRVEVSLPVFGWLEVASPIAVEAAIGGRRLVADGSRYPVPPGRHRVEFSNAALRFRESQEVVVEAGEVARVALTSAGGTLEASSDQPADVFVDGARVGRTPLSGVAVPLGRHEVRFVHPSLGEVGYEVFISTGSTQLHATFGAPTQARPVRAATAPRRTR
jgi:hypothetical protein